MLSVDGELAAKCRRGLRSGLVFFILAGFIGVVMRYAFVGDLPEWISFKNIRHAHSHVALLGWLHAGLYIFIVLLYDLQRLVYQRLFWLTQATVLGMLISFPIQGYGGFSIVFVSIFIFLSYYFIYLVWNDLSQMPKDHSTIFLKTALLFLFISSLGTWGLAIFMNTGLRGSAWYYGAIQFYLHFQFNGWLIFGVLALLFRWLSMKNIELDHVKMIWFYRILLISAFLTFAIAVTWSTPLPFLFWINSIGVLVQLAALIIFIQIARKFTPKLRNIITKEIYVLLGIAMLSFVVKILIQTMVVIPYFATISYTIRNFVIGFIHLLMLGCISLFLIALFHHFIQLNTRLSTGMKIFVAAVVLSELLIFYQGMLLWVRMGFMDSYYVLIFVLSLFMPIGVIIYFLRTRKGVFVK